MEAVVKIPPLPSRLLGHKLVAAPLILGGFATLYACWQAGNDAALPAVLTLLMICWVGRVSQQMDAYHSWTRAWASMAEPVPNRYAGWWRKPLGVMSVAGVALYVGSRADEAEYQVALGWMVLVAIVAMVALLWRTIRHRRLAKHRATVTPVTICARPVMKPLTLEAAYRALPDYCQQVMRP